MTCNEFKASYPTINTDQLHFQGIIQAIKQYQKKCNVMLKAEYKNTDTKSVQCINNGNKCVKLQLTDSETEAAAVKKWNNIYLNLKWSRIFSKCNKITADTKLKWFQIRLIHRILPTNRFLYICRIKDSPECTFCKTEEETITHHFWSCPVIVPFWKNLENMIKKKNALTAVS